MPEWHEMGTDSSSTVCAARENSRYILQIHLAMAGYLRGEKLSRMLLLACRRQRQSKLDGWHTHTHTQKIEMFTGLDV